MVPIWPTFKSWTARFLPTQHLSQISLWTTTSTLLLTKIQDPLGPNLTQLTATHSSWSSETWRLLRITSIWRKLHLCLLRQYCRSFNTDLSYMTELETSGRLCKLNILRRRWMTLTDWDGTGRSYDGDSSIIYQGYEYTNTWDTHIYFLSLALNS